MFLLYIFIVIGVPACLDLIKTAFVAHNFASVISAFASKPRERRRLRCDRG